MRTRTLLVAAHVLEHVEGHGLVLGLLERVPAEQRADLVGVELGAGRVVPQERLGEGGGVVLEAGGEGELGALRRDLAEDAEADLHPLVGEAGGVAELVEALVEGAVLAAVQRLLADEALHLLLEHGVGDLVAVVAHAADEEVLALREHRREHGGDVAAQDVVGHEVLGRGVLGVARCRGGGPRWCAPGPGRGVTAVGMVPPASEFRYHQ